MMVCQEEPLVNKISELYEKISNLESLKPSQDVNMLFTQLVHTCMPPNPIDVTKLPKFIRVQHFDPTLHPCTQTGRLRGVRSTPSYIDCARPLTQFDNYDNDPSANEMAARLVEHDPDLSVRMKFHTKDVMSVGKEELKEYDVVFLAALVGMNKEDKIKIIHHLAKNMAQGTTLMVRSAHGARAFLYPVVDPEDLCGFEVLSVFHPMDEIINSIVIARKAVDNDLSSSLYPLEWQQNHTQNFSPIRLQSCKSLEIQPFNPLKYGSILGELASSGHQ